ncbi:MAG: hypothetical protein HY554_07830 [Elusimicrobia bacterium]|nr:hypothetical protein [Elusimicrobiota bacterium]
MDNQPDPLRRARAAALLTLLGLCAVAPTWASCPEGACVAREGLEALAKDRKADKTYDASASAAPGGTEPVAAGAITPDVEKPKLGRSLGERRKKTSVYADPPAPPAQDKSATAAKKDSKGGIKGALAKHKWTIFGVLAAIAVVALMPTGIGLALGATVGLGVAYGGTKWSKSKA